MRHYQFILFDWFMIAKPIVLYGMEELRYSMLLIIHGVLSVTIHGVLKMPMLCADSWGSSVQSLPSVSNVANCFLFDIVC